MTNKVSFFKQVKAEAVKISWPNRKEVVYHSIVVFVLSIILALFFLFADFMVIHLVQFILNFGA